MQKNALCILILTDHIPPENRGGAGKVAWSQAQGLQAAGVDVHVVAATPHPSFEENRAGLPTYHLHSAYPERWRAWFSLYNPQTLPPLRALLERLRPDIVHAHNIHTDLSYASLSLAHRLGIRTVFTAHDAMSVAYTRLNYFVQSESCEVNPHLPPFYNVRQARLRYNPARNRMIRHILTRHVDKRLAVSQALREVLTANGLPDFEVVHNGLNQQAFDTPSQAVVGALAERLGLSGKKVILFAGRLSEDKGSRPLLAALDRLLPACPEARLLVLSAAPLEPDLLQGWSHLTSAHIVSAGWLEGESLQAAYHLADVVAVPSVYLDPFPTVNLEAMAAGKPVITTCYGGASEAVRDGLDGFVINPLQTARFTECLRLLLTKPDLAATMGASGKAHAQKQFTLEAQVSVLLSLYQAY